MSEVTSAQSPKKRGVAPGTVRQQCFVHAAVNKKGELILELVDGFSQEETAKLFKDKNKIASQASVGPLLEFKGKKATSASARESVRLDTKDLLNITSTKYSGQFKGWKIVGNGMKAMNVNGKSYADNELIRVIFETPADEANKGKKPRLGANDVLPASLIENLKTAS